jgi:hypothetical protein
VVGLAKIGTKIYYDKATCNVLVRTSEMENGVVETTLEEDMEVFEELKGRAIDSIGLIQLEYGQYQQDFFESSGNFRINPDTLELEFSYPDPNEPDAPQVFQKPLTEQIKQLEQQTQQVNDDLSAFMDFVLGGM